jgi:hypothetical protein
MIASTTAGRRPSEKFGTHSIRESGIFTSCAGPRRGAYSLFLELFPEERIADLKHDAGVHSRVAVPQRRAGDVDAVAGESNRAAGLDEIVKAESTLRRKIPDAGAAWLPVRDEDVRGKFMRGIDESAGSLKPGSESAGGFEVPSKDDRRQTDTGEGSTAHENGIGVVESRSRVVDGFLLQALRRRKRLPVGHDLAGKLELAAEDAAEMLAGKHFPEAEASAGEMEIGAIADTGPSLEERAVIPRALSERRAGRSLSIG